MPYHKQVSKSMARIKYVLQERRRAMIEADSKIKAADLTPEERAEFLGRESGEPSFAEEAEPSRPDAPSGAHAGTLGPAFMDGNVPPHQTGTPQQQPSGP